MHSTKRSKCSIAIEQTTSSKLIAQIFSETNSDQLSSFDGVVPFYFFLFILIIVFIIFFIYQKKKRRSKETKIKQYFFYNIFVDILSLCSSKNSIQTEITCVTEWKLINNNIFICLKDS